MKNWILEKLDSSLHDRSHFACGVDILNEYLKSRANQEQKKNLSVTFVATIGNELPKPIAGYFTLSNNSLSYSVVPPHVQKGVPSTYEIPSILIGKFAVDLNYQSQGVGKFLLKNALMKVVEMTAITGIKCVSVRAKNEIAENFYKKFGFVPLVDDPSLMILPVETILKASDSP